MSGLVIEGLPRQGTLGSNMAWLVPMTLVKVNKCCLPPRSAYSLPQNKPRSIR